MTDIRAKKTTPERFRYRSGVFLVRCFLFFVFGFFEWGILHRQLVAFCKGASLKQGSDHLIYELLGLYLGGLPK